MLNQYNAIASKSKSNTISNKEQVKEFKKIVQEAFDKKQITKEDAEKMGFVGAGVAAVSGTAGLVVDGIREGYDLLSGERGQQTVFTHWATDRDVIQAKPKEK